MNGAAPPRTPADFVDVLDTMAHERRSGVFTIRDGAPLATLTLSAGRLVRLRRFPSTDSLGALLVRVGVLQTADLHGPVGETIEQVMERVGQRRGESHLLVRADDAVADEMYEATLALLQRGRGAVAFRPDADMMPSRGTIDDDTLTLPSGLELEELILDARARGARFPLEGGDLDEAGRRPPGIVAIDDDPAFLGALAAAFGRANVSATLLSTTTQACTAVSVLGPADVLLVDLFRPRSSGRGFLGGLEVLRAAHDAGVSDRVFLSFESPHADAEREAARLGAAGVLRRPHGDDPALLATFLRPVLARVIVGDEEPAHGYDLAGALREEFSELERPAIGPVDVPLGDADELETLKTMLGELNTPTFEEQIPLLVLRFASTFFSRGALFRVDAVRDEFIGLGGFGVGGDDPGRLVRSIRMPCEAPCVLADALQARTSSMTQWTSRAADELLREKLGARAGDELFAAPLRSSRGIEGVLIADNAGAARNVPNLALVEIFVQQAAAAMERAARARAAVAVGALAPGPTSSSSSPSAASTTADPLTPAPPAPPAPPARD